MLRGARFCVSCLWPTAGDTLPAAVSELESLEQTCPSPGDVKAPDDVQVLLPARGDWSEDERMPIL